jgi:hypothetical protein
VACTNGRSGTVRRRCSITATVGGRSSMGGTKCGMCGMMCVQWVVCSLWGLHVIGNAVV